MANRDDLDRLARAAVGGGRRLAAVSRLAGGSKKGAYRLAFDDGFTAVAYLWAEQENYWPAATADAADPFSDASGAALFEAAYRELSVAGARTPRVYLLDRSGRHYPADAAVVEDVPGGNLKALLDRDPLAAVPVLRQLAETLGDLAAQVRPRREYRLIHGELGPEHLLLDRDGSPVIIDIEGLMFFDVEWEHAFLKIRFGQQYRLLERPGLDRQRMGLYTLAMCLSLVAGPLRLLDGDFPDRDGMTRIAEASIRRSLAFLARSPGPGQATEDHSRAASSRVAGS
jgi:hypothetical protein